MSAATPNPTESLTAAQVIARRLKEAGVRHAFGMPGGEILTMMDALDEAGIDFVLVKHENCGGFMAEGTYHRTHAPGVLLATVGPGAANAFNVVANAQQDRVPLIFLTGRVDPSETYTYTHQVFDHARNREGEHEMMTPHIHANGTPGARLKSQYMTATHVTATKASSQFFVVHQERLCGFLASRLGIPTRHPLAAIQRRSCRRG